MIGDFYTKPQQGKKFEEFRRIIMGILAPISISEPQECIGRIRKTVKFREGEKE